MSTANFSSGGSHTKTFGELLCSPSLVGGLQPQLSICFLAVDILLSITAFAGNSCFVPNLSLMNITYEITIRGKYLKTSLKLFISCCNKQFRFI